MSPLALSFVYPILLGIFFIICYFRIIFSLGNGSEASGYGSSPIHSFSKGPETRVCSLDWSESKLGPSLFHFCYYS